MPRMKYPDLISFVLAVMFLSASIAHASSDAETVAQQFREFCLQESTDHGKRLLDDVELPKGDIAQTMKYLASLKDDGSWPDLEYESHARSAWEPGDHLTRMLNMIVFARRSDTPADQSATCIEGVHRALAFWIKHDFKCPNWWYNEIGGPKILGTVALLLNQDLKPEELKYITETSLARSKVGSMTGQNRVWLAGNGIMRAAITNDDSLLKKAADVIAEEIRVTDSEGIQPDWSFHQHGPQQQFGNYGMAFASEITKWSVVLRGTHYAFPELKLEILRNYLLQGQNWITWNGSLDISACGRQLFPNSQKTKAASIRGVMQSMAGVDVEHAGDYLAFSKRNSAGGINDLLGTRLFWRSDYTVARQHDWFATLKMSSERVIGGETVNTENLSGLHLADGATFIYRTGHEYDNIFPVWDWRKIPGTTAALDQSSLTWSAKEHAKTTFVGGACDGTTAAIAMDFHRDQLQAKKTWFFSGDRIICLGADITSTSNDPIVTTIDQCLLAGKIVVHQHDKEDTFANGSSNLKDSEWVEHAGTRYELLGSQSLSISAIPQTGNWKAVFQNPSTPKADVMENVFTLCMEHGIHPSGGSYAYSISPADHLVETKTEILANTDKIQAVKVGDHWSAAIFWSAGKIELNGKAIEVDQPCAVLLVDQQITIADPTEKLKSLQLTVDGTRRTIDLPQGGEAGSSIKL
jgi:chondroitin AC lyase